MLTTKCKFHHRSIPHAWKCYVFIPRDVTWREAFCVDGAQVRTSRCLSLLTRCKDLTCSAWTSRRKTSRRWLWRLDLAARTQRKLLRLQRYVYRHCCVGILTKISFCIHSLRFFLFSLLLCTRTQWCVINHFFRHLSGIHHGYISVTSDSPMTSYRWLTPTHCLLVRSTLWFNSTWDSCPSGGAAAASCTSGTCCLLRVLTPEGVKKRRTNAVL